MTAPRVDAGDLLGPDHPIEETGGNVGGPGGPPPHDSPEGVSSHTAKTRRVPLRLPQREETPRGLSL
ncbi:hypothetical protein NDU88_001925 [Pleurodeles waltl]|uniref:Uncharacterized protein n=1 Tax=Pleurodeles waltl TaxID=8319 RepID=A0AAV7TJP4_PLEWA|nr:hypothetical protein NDU88_001925 [Pleurodeles waltl]